MDLWWYMQVSDFWNELYNFFRETRECFLLEVSDRSAATLMKAIQENIEEGSIIFSDCWKGYRTEELEEAGFEHFKVNHKYNFLDPDDPNVHTQTVERMWGSAKWRNRSIAAPLVII